MRCVSIVIVSITRLGARAARVTSLLPVSHTPDICDPKAKRALRFEYDLIRFLFFTRGLHDRK